MVNLFKLIAAIKVFFIFCFESSLTDVKAIILEYRLVVVSEFIALQKDDIKSIVISYRDDSTTYKLPTGISRFQKPDQGKYF